MALDLSLEFADPQRAFVLLAYIMRRRTREQVKVRRRGPSSLQSAVLYYFVSYPRSALIVRTYRVRTAPEPEDKVCLRYKA